MREIIIEVPDDFGKTLEPERVNTTINGDIIRCKECKYFDIFDGIYPWCKKWGGGSCTHPDGYCFIAERRDPHDRR